MRQQRAIETRARIVVAASEYFGERGYRATRMADVAKRADCALGALQFHFQTKAALAKEVIDQQHSIVMATAASVLRCQSASGIKDVIVVSTRLAELIATDSVVRAGLRLSTESIDELASISRTPYLDWIQFCTRLLEKAANAGELQRDVNLEDLAEVINSAFTGAQFLSAALTGSVDLPDRLARLWPVIFSRVSVETFDTVRVRQILGSQSDVPRSAVGASSTLTSAAIPCSDLKVV